MTIPRFHVPEAAPGARLSLPEWSAHHAREVLRLRPGAAIRVFDGVGHEFDATLDSITRKGVDARLGAEVASRPESPLHLTLAVSPLKGDRMELVIQKATELGVDEIWPVVTVRTDAAARPALRGTRHERWDKVASGAAEQCGRAVVPVIVPAMTLDACLAQTIDGERIVLLETEGPPPLASVARHPSRVLLLVGPAGGFDGGEASRLVAAGFRAAALGPRILRAETAAVVAVALAQALWGDLGGEPDS